MRALVIACIFGSFGGCRGGEPSGPRARLVYSIDLGATIDDKAEELRRDLEVVLADRKIAGTVRVAPNGALTVTAADGAGRLVITQLVTASYADTVELSPCAAPDGPNATCLRISSAYARTLEQTALHNAVATVRARLVNVEVTDPVVVEQANQIVVEVPAGDLEQLGLIEDLISRVGKVELKVVDDGSDYMKRLFAHVGDAADPVAIEQGITTDIDRWRAEDAGPVHVDYLLVAYDREEEVTAEQARQLGCRANVRDGGHARCLVTGRAAIERYVRDLSAKDPSFRVPDDRQIAYEQRLAGPEARDRRPSWRSYYLERSARLTGTAITNATTSYDPNTNRPIVLIELGRFGTRVFGDLTAQVVGKKLATLLDGKIKSAPIINGAIRGGRASIMMGGTDLRRQETEAAELVNVLRAGALPAPLRLETKQML